MKISALSKAVIFTFAAFTMGISSAEAQEGKVQDLLQCDKIKKTEDRLACFNAIVEKLKTDPDAFHEQRREAEGQKPDYTRTYSGEDAFGRSRKYFKDSTPNQVASAIKSSWKNPIGRYTFFLENGQIWQETSGSSLTLPKNPQRVTVKKGLLGGFTMTVRGSHTSGRSGKVKRID
jgi:hypothetical protein